MGYAQKNYPQIQGINGKYSISSIGCFVTSFCNLFADFGFNIDPLTLNNQLRDRSIFIDVDDGIRDDLGWNSATHYDPNVVVSSVVGAGQWPPTNQAIVKFHYQSIQNPWKMVNGKRVANMIDHFCKVASWQDHTIVDSWDGAVKPAGVYGSPVGYATYTHVSAPVPAPAPAPPAPATSPDLYRLIKSVPGYTNSTNAANRQGSNSVVPSGSYAIFNESHGMLNITRKPGQAGWWINPGDNAEATPAPPSEPVVTYEVLASPRLMHIKKPGGAEKWAFGNIKKWSDFSSAGHFPENTNIEIVAIAHVPVGSEVAAYYMTAGDLGEYRTLGRVAFAIGFNWADMADGYVEPPKPAPAVVPEPAPAPPVITKPAPVPVPSNTFKTTYSALPVPARYIARETMMIHEYDTRRPDRELLENMAVLIAGTFTKDNVLYGRPLGSVQSGYWFGIPMSNLIAEDELYNTKLDLPTKAAINRLSFGERITVWLSKVLSQYTRFVRVFKKKQK